jgi:hypothetical protein
MIFIEKVQRHEVEALRKQGFRVACSRNDVEDTYKQVYPVIKSVHGGWVAYVSRFEYENEVKKHEPKYQKGGY